MWEKQTREILKDFMKVTLLGYNIMVDKLTVTGG